jgi:hypothetical protein
MSCFVPERKATISDRHDERLLGTGGLQGSPNKLQTRCRNISTEGRDFCNLAATSFSCKLGPDRPGRLPGTPESNQNPALRPRPNILRKCRGPQPPQNSPNPVATPKGCQGNKQNRSRIYLRPPAKYSKKVAEILNKSMSQGTEIGILQSLGLLV